MTHSHVRRTKGPTLAEQHAPRVAELVAEGMSCREIAAQLGISANTVSRAAKLTGASFDRSRTAAATEAVKIDATARRVQLTDMFGTITAKALAQLGEALDRRELEPRLLVTLTGVAADKFAKLGPEFDLTSEREGESRALLEDFIDAIRDSVPDPGDPGYDEMVLSAVAPGAVVGSVVGFDQLDDDTDTPDPFHNN